MRACAGAGCYHAGMELVSINVGAVEAQLIDEVRTRTGIVKQSVDRPMMLRASGLEGDGVGNTRDHGGPDQAVYAYAAEHYDWWAAELMILVSGMLGK